MLKVLRKRLECHLTEFYVFDLSDPSLTYLQDELSQRIDQIANSISTLVNPKRVILVKGLENSIGLFGDYPPVLQDLNFVRDALADSVPYPVLFCLPSYAINRVIKFAPDFWSWKSGVFRILASHDRQDEASIYALHTRKLLGGASQLEKQEQIKLLEKLAQEFDPLAANRNKTDLRIAVQALIELGIVYISSGEFLKAQAALKPTTQIFVKSEWQPETQRDVAIRIRYLIWQGWLDCRLGRVAQANQGLNTALVLSGQIDLDLKAVSSSCLGRLKAQQGQIEKAITLFQQALDIHEHIGHPQGKARNLHAIASIKVQQGQVEEAIALFQQSVVIYEHIGDAHGKAATLNAIASIKVQQGQVEEAITLFQQSMVIYEHIGDAHGKAATLNEIAKIKVQQGQVEEAITLFQQSLKIDERIGNPYGKAATLKEIAKIKAQQGQVEEASKLFQQSLDIFERIGSPYGKAATLRELASISANQGDVDKANKLYEESLAILKRVGAVLGQAKTLWKYGEFLADDQPDLTIAVSYLQESLDILRRLGSPDAVTVKALLEQVQVRANSYP
ncbi:tetratricopeptide repeat protein [Leptolyngbya sp. FACHB-60]|nr:tetratricopeptide repeat protein [Leptolyngbya sp. FACHB-60]MBD1914901.1 tetratricopeptide repeat protein [Phormidium sp. FACHB-77]MBD2051777.1 tetratricopeptide repeat protein [Leptolyngbya sp. FACHB-60]